MDTKKRQTRLVRRITAGVVAGALTLAGGLGLVAAGQGTTASVTAESGTGASGGGSSGLRSAGQAPGTSGGQGSIVSGGS